MSGREVSAMEGGLVVCCVVIGCVSVECMSGMGVTVCLGCLVFHKVCGVREYERMEWRGCWLCAKSVHFVLDVQI